MDFGYVMLYLEVSSWFGDPEQWHAAKSPVDGERCRCLMDRFLLPVSSIFRSEKAGEMRRFRIRFFGVHTGGIHMKSYLKRIVQNAAILLLVLIGVRSMVAALPFPMRALEKLDAYYLARIHPEAVDTHGILSFLTGFLLVVLALRLYKRIRVAWVMELGVLAAFVTMNILRYHTVWHPVILAALVIMAILGYSWRDFSRRSDRITAKWALLLGLTSLTLVVLSASAGIFMLRGHYSGVHDFTDAFLRAVRFLVFMEPAASGFTTKFGKLYADSLITLNWICIVGSVLLLLKPLIYNPIADATDHAKARELVNRYGQNPLSYLALESDKRYFFGADGVEGVAAYGTAGGVMVVCGDIICKPEHSVPFLSQLMQFSAQNGWDLLFVSVTERFLELYKAAGFGCVKYGEEACFCLDEYNLSGGSVAKVRAAINHANHAGITTTEYKPAVSRDAGVEAEIDAISKLWLENKKGGELAFMLGGTGLQNPMDRRYFIARAADGKMLGFVVLLPYDGAKAYLADVTRRLPDAPQGVLEKLIYDAFQQLKAEGVQWGNMGLCPLYNVRESDRTTITERLFSFAYDHLNDVYGFKALFHAKKKYAPTHWKARYLVYAPQPFSPQYAYALVKLQNPGGISEILLSQLKSNLKNEV